jgi:hypothetical protein
MCPNGRSYTVYSLGFNRIQINCSDIEDVHQSHRYLDRAYLI